MRDKIPAHVKREAAVKALVDPRTLERYLDGESVRGLSAARIERALAELGIEPRDPRNPTP